MKTHKLFTKILRLTLKISWILGFGSNLLGAASAAAPQLLSPPHRMEMTDVAAFFSWSKVADCANFELQIARDYNFKNIYKEVKTENKGYRPNSYFPKDLLPPGIYFWRVRAVLDGKPGTWSEPSGFRVNDLHLKKNELIRTISPQTPLFLMRNRAWDPRKSTKSLQQIIPPHLQQVIIVDDTSMASDQVFDRAKKYQESGVDFVIWNDRGQVSLATIEYIFQNYSHCIGTAEGEHFSGMYWERGPEGNLAELDYIHRAWTLCAKYGRFYFFADGDNGHYRWPVFAQKEKERLKTYRRNVVLMFKTTNGDVALHSYGAVAGLLARGMTENSGIWVDEWIWPIAGFGKLGETIPPDQIWSNRRKVGTKQCPWIYDIQMWLMGIVSGSTVFHLESAHQWTGDGRPSRQYTRIFLPFVKAVVERQLIPSRQAFFASLKLAVITDPKSTEGKHAKRYTGGFAYLNELYKIKDTGDREFIPNDSRYGIVCLLPAQATDLSVSPRILPQSELSDPIKAKELFDRNYPLRFTGDAFMWECDGTVIITNSNENQDIAQRFTMPIEQNIIREISGEIGVHQYLIGKLSKDGKSFWFQANGEYPDRTFKITLACTDKPNVLVTPSTAAKEIHWNADSRSLQLSLSNAEGAVEVNIKN